MSTEPRRPCRPRFLLLAAAIVLAAAALRLPALDQRPFHGDEAENATRALYLWQNDHYRYDPAEYHGPTLAYLTLPGLLALGGASYADTDEATYRRIVAIVGVGLVALTLCAAPGIGVEAALVAGALSAVSIALTYYSRYYIHEIVLVFFTWAAILCGWRYVVAARGGRRRLPWALACGACLGLMHATKETAAIAVAALIAAGVATLVLDRRGPAARPARPLWHPPSLAAGLLLGAALSALLYSSFFTHARGPLDSLLAYMGYFSRGAGSATVHVHPWYWYLAILGWARPDLEPRGLSEALILALAVAGAVAVARGRGIEARHRPFALFLTCYALVLLVAYSALPYKTPWNVLGALRALTLVAGVGAVALVRAMPSRPLRGLAALVLAVGGVHLLYQSWRASFVLHTESGNPHVYGHPLPSVRQIPRRLEALARYHPAGLAMSVIVLTDRNIWPLPFYLRHLPNVRFEFGTVPEVPWPPIIIVNRELVGQLGWETLPGYAGPQYFPLRPDVDLAMFVQRRLWERFEREMGSPDRHRVPEPRPGG